MHALAKLQSLVYQHMKVAHDAVSTLQLTEKARTKVAKSMLADIPTFSKLDLGAAAAIWAPVVFVDMRNSTWRASSLGAKKTYITMHGLLPAMAYVATEQNGYIVGFRGDGLFAVFGIDEKGQPRRGQTRGTMIGEACSAGLAMVEAVQKVVNPALDDFEIPGDIKIGVGIDAGQIIVTRIGLLDGFEITAYGDAVNTSAKLCARGNDEVIISTDANKELPSTRTGRIRVVPIADRPEMGLKLTTSHVYFPEL